MQDKLFHFFALSAYCHINILFMTTTTFFTYADTLVKRKRKAGKHATADLYRASSNWFLRFCGNAELSFADITPGMIDRFLYWLQAGGPSENQLDKQLPEQSPRYLQHGRARRRCPGRSSVAFRPPHPAGRRDRQTCAAYRDARRNRPARCLR